MARLPRDLMDINKMTDMLEPEESGDLMDMNKMTDMLEPEENGVGELQLPGKGRLVFRPSER
ncbi:hypothetical protein Tco_1389688, partial [Tanacetum coccineum]